ncbi:MAG: lysophospholipid acyltransferase family protein [Myxococcales bacterium]|nr:lysophospholipid acyltransferase family protein [Myxococcales bacterium]
MSSRSEAQPYDPVAPSASDAERVPSDLPRTPAEARRSHLESAAWRRVLVGGIRLLPPSIVRASLPGWAAFFYPQVPAVRRAIRANLLRLGASSSPLSLERRAFGVFERYVETVANAYSYYVAGRMAERAPTRGLEHMRAALDGGRGAVLVTGHIGNWQLGPALLGRDGFPPLTVVMAQEPNAQTQQMERALRDRRVRVVYPSETPMLALALRARLEQGELVAMQIDRPAGERGLRVPLLDGFARFAAGPALLARALDVPVVPVFFPLRRDGRVETLIERPRFSSGARSQDGELTAGLAALYERYVRAYPEQWFNFFDMRDGGR